MPPPRGLIFLGREAVGTEADFMAMVRSSYPMVYRPASVAFLKPEGKDDKAIFQCELE